MEESCVSPLLLLAEDRWGQLVTWLRVMGNSYGTEV